MTAACGATLTTAHRVVDRVHGGAAVVRATTEPTAPARLAESQTRVLRVADLADTGAAVEMDEANLASIRARTPRGATAKIALLLDVVESKRGASVADPYYGDESDFEECWATVSLATQALAARLMAQTAT